MNSNRIRTGLRGPGEYGDVYGCEGNVAMVAGDVVEWSWAVMEPTAGVVESVAGATGARLSIFPAVRPAEGSDVALLQVDSEPLTECSSEDWRSGAGQHGKFILTGALTGLLAALVQPGETLAQGLAVIEVWVDGGRRTVGMGPVLVMVNRLGEYVPGNVLAHAGEVLVHGGPEGYPVA